MQRIKINEVDLTSNVVVSAITDIVFVPGFATEGDSFEPTLCTTVSEFEEAFGAKCPTFKNDQPWPGEFAEDAINTESGLMFAEGACDPSYVYAKELISRGLPVLYEKINLSNDDIDVETMYNALDKVYTTSTTDFVITQPKDFNRKFAGVYDKDTEVPYLKWDIVSVEDEDGNNKYYRFIKDSKKITDARLLGQEIPEDTEEFDESKAYVEGNKVLHKNKLYVALTNIDAGDWIEDNWEFVTEPVGDEISLIPLNDRNEYDIKYLTSGGYPVFEYFSERGGKISDKMMKLGQSRGDCMVFIDHTDNPDRPILATNKHSVYYSLTHEYRVTDSSAEVKGIGYMLTPWAMYVNNHANTPKLPLIALPGSFTYLLCLAESLNYNPAWLAVAGVHRGVIPTSLFNCLSLGNRNKMTITTAESYQNEDGSLSLNAITNVKPYGYTIWGNRTLYDSSETGGTKASSFMNIRNMVCDIKKQVYVAAKSCLFEQNTDVLWVNFKSMISPMLDKMVKGSGLSGFSFEKLESKDRTKLRCKIIVYPVYAVESFDITVVLTDDDEVNIEG